MRLRAHGMGYGGDAAPRAIPASHAAERRRIFVQGKELRRRRTGGTSSRKRRSPAQKDKPSSRRDCRDCSDPCQGTEFPGPSTFYSKPCGPIFPFPLLFIRFPLHPTPLCLILYPSCLLRGIYIMPTLYILPHPGENAVFFESSETLALAELSLCAQSLGALPASVRAESLGNLRSISPPRLRRTICSVSRAFPARTRFLKKTAISSARCPSTGGASSAKI